MSRAMLSFSLLPVFIVLSMFSVNAFSAQTCNSGGEVPFICGTTNPEDLYQIPETPWVIASGRVSDVAVRSTRYMSVTTASERYFRKEPHRRHMTR